MGVRDKLIKIGEMVVEKAWEKRLQAEAFLLHDKELSIEVVGGQVETLKEAEETGLGIRVISQGRLGFAYTTDLGANIVEEMLESAVESSRYTSADENNVLPAGKFQYPQVDTCDPAIRSATLEEKIELAKQVEVTAREYDKRVTVIERTGYEDSEYTLVVINTDGVHTVEKGSFCGLYAYLVAEEDGDAQTGFSFISRKHFLDLKPVEVGREAANNAVRMLKGRTVSSQSIPCVLEPYVVTNFLSILSNSVNADSVQKGKSLFAGKLGQTVAANELTLVDDGIYENGVASFPFDGEGVPSQRTVLLENGVLRAFLYDTYTARKDQTNSTGNGVRASFRSLPGVGTTNFFLVPGSKRSNDLVREISRGLYVTEVMGMHTANPISGDFSVGAAGILIENGELTRPVRSITIAGNLQEFLRNVEGVGDDLRFFGGVGAPSIRLKALSIAGE